MSDTELIPVDKERCQAEKLDGSFMTFGPRQLIRCNNRPVWIATEKKAREDGLKGSMSLCHACAEKMKEKMGKNYAILEPLDSACSDK